MNRTAVVLFNLGGPDRLEAVAPFLFNLFNDPAIIAAPAPLRWLLAKALARRRTPTAREIYAKLGGASPILEETRGQARALEAALAEKDGRREWRVVVAMRYWHPFADEAAAEVRAFGPDRIALLPLYPQYSGTTTGSSLADWRRAAAAAGLEVPTGALCCYPDHPGFVGAQVDLISAALEAARTEVGPAVPLRLLLSAHGLPERIIARGDPYQWQVERTAAAVEAGLREGRLLEAGSEAVTCYQSRVGPLEWIGPATDEEIRRAGADGAGVVVAPIAFVSEHSETLVELDIEYAALARKAGAACYHRVPALGTREGFIAALAELAGTALEACGGDGRPLAGMCDGVACPDRFAACPRSTAAAQPGRRGP